MRLPILSRRDLIRKTIPTLGAVAALPALAKVPKVRIAKIESFAVHIPPGGAADPLKIYRYGVTRVHTDSGVTGTSFIACPADTLERWIKPTLTGEDLFAVDRHLKRLQMQRGESGVQQWSGVEHALWDAIGKVANLPVAKLLGGYRDKLRVYRTCVFPGKQDQSDVAYDTQAAFAVRLKKNGYTGIKIRAWRPRPLDDADAAGVIRSAVGNDFEIMFDRTAVRPGWVWDYATGLAVARALEKHRAAWLEEPFDGFDLNGPARLAAEVEIPITGGELGKSVYDFLNFLTQKTYDILQPDARICGGIWIARKIGILAESFGVPCIQHGTSGLTLAGWIQSGCAMPNCEWQEVIGGPNLPEEEWEPGVKLLRTAQAFRVENGYIHLPELPGIGLDLNEDAIREYRVPHV
jgi:L-alanine-DL-glutamate epimerase-like enolase superfamily enzyme